MKKQIAFGIAALLLLATPIARGAGITIITHGLNGNADGWVTGMANQVPNHTRFPGSSRTFYRLSFYYSAGSYYMTWSRPSGSSPSSTDSGEIVVALDWSQLADGNSFNTTQVAGVVAFNLLSTNFISELNGHALCELPLHLIGHSRGGSLMSEISRLLGANGVWVDHLTTLDPHPLNNDGFSDPYSAVDGPVRTYLNVLFHDNYWQDLSFFVHGEPVSGAYVRQLYDLYGGYESSDFFYEHANVHLWYHGTVDERNPADDIEAQITSTEFSSWYVSNENYGFNAGFKWSLIGGGDRTSASRPLGAGYPAIRDGYNQAWDLGAGQFGNRTFLPANNGSWPNIMKFNIVGSNAVPMGGSVSNKYYFQFGKSTSSTATVQVFLDGDANPYNGNSGQVLQTNVPGTGTNFISPKTNSFNVTNPPGQYYVYAKVTGSNHVRYLYAPEKLTITDATTPTVSITNPSSAKTYTNSLTVTIGASASDNVGVARVDFYDGASLRSTDTASPYSYDWFFTDADNGAHVWTARAYDAAGNVSTSSSVTLTVSIDVTPPTVAISSPANGATLVTSSIMVSGTASDPGSPSSGLSTVEVRINGASWSLATGTANWTRAVILSPCGNAIEARSRDIAGNYSVTSSVAVTYAPPNTVPSTPSNVSPTNGASGLPLTPMLQASAFSDADCVGDTHAASQWQVLNGAGAIVVGDSGTDTINRVSWNVPAAKLYYGSNYQWRVRYQDSRNGWSAYSPQTAFTTFGPSLVGSKQGTNTVFKWPTNALGFTLQWSTNLNVVNWSNATPSAVIANGQYTVTNSITNKFKFYRLKK
jgi:hypothetical protein